MRRLATLIILVSAALARPADSTAQPVPGSAAVVREILSLPDDQLDYGRAKLALDQIIDPSLNVDAALAEIDRLASRAGALAGAGASPATHGRPLGGGAKGDNRKAGAWHRFSGPRAPS